MTFAKRIYEICRIQLLPFPSNSTANKLQFLTKQPINYNSYSQDSYFMLAVFYKRSVYQKMDDYIVRTDHFNLVTRPTTKFTE